MRLLPSELFTLSLHDALPICFFIRTDLKINHDELAKLFKERSLSAQSSLSDEEIIENAQKSLESGIEKGKKEDESYEGPLLEEDEKAVAGIMYTSNENEVH